jgi:hypothetical protein
MEWLNIHRSTVEGEAMQDACAEDVQTWLFLMTYCAGQENGGRIVGARGWNDRKWTKLAGLSLRRVGGVGADELPAEKPADAPTGLWRWEGDDLVVEYYPVEQESRLRKQRRGGAIGGKKRAENFRSQGSNGPRVEGEGQGSLKGKVEGEGQGSLERKGREGKEKKGKERVREDALAPEDESFSGELPSEAEVRDWAVMAGVDPEFAAQKWSATNENHGWVKNGRVIEWRGRFKRFWEEDRAGWLRRAKGQGPTSNKNGAENFEKPAGWREGDQVWWWTEEVGLLGNALAGAFLAGDVATAERLKEVVRARQ